MSEYKLAVGMPNTGTIKTRTVFSLFRMSLRTKFDLIFQNSCAIHKNREKIVEEAISLGCTHVLFIDSDMTFEEDAAERLLERNKDIIGVNAYKRQLPLVSTITGLNGETCDYLGTGFLLINLSVFKNLSKPWFFWKENLGEDAWFCEKAREAGYKLNVDMTVKVGHLGEYIYG